MKSHGNIFFFLKYTTSKYMKWIIGIWYFNTVTTANRSSKVLFYYVMVTCIFVCNIHNLCSTKELTKIQVWMLLTYFFYFFYFSLLLSSRKLSPYSNFEPFLKKHIGLDFGGSWNNKSSLFQTLSMNSWRIFEKFHMKLIR